MSTFDRVRPRTPERDPSAPTGRADLTGRRALFSDSVEVSAPGSLVVSCSRCGRRTSVNPLRAIATLVPSLHVWPLRRRYPSLVRCPACHQHAWSKLSIHL